MKELVIQGIRKAYDGQQVLKDVSFRFPAGSTTCILGPSGCGKTTLLRIIAGLEPPDAGMVEGLPERISFVFQEDRLCEAFSALSNIRMVTGKETPEAEIRRMLTAMDLGAEWKKPVRDFSGGMKRRVAIARALCYPAELLLMDEPFKGLDEKLHEEVIRTIQRESAGRTVICVTHDPADAERMGGRKIEMEKEEHEDQQQGRNP